MPETPRGRFLLLLALWVLLVAVLLPVREVTPPDEPRFTHQAQEMKEDGDWIVPKIGGLPNADKPPMLFWAVNVASLLLPRVNEVAARIPSALASLLVLLLTVLLGRRLWGSEEIGWGAAMIALTGIEFFQKAQWVSCDMLMTAGVFVAITCFREALFEDEAFRVRGILLGWLAVAAAVLTKGPVGLLWPVFWVVSEAAARRRWRALLRLFHPAGPALFALVVGGWLYAFGAHAGSAYLDEAVFKQNLTRYVSAWNAVNPWYFYFSQVPLDLLPWSLFFPAAAALVIRRWRGGNDTAAVRASAIFVLLGFGFFSGSSGKRGVYLLPMFPVVALLLAAAFHFAGRGRGPARAWRSAGLAAMAALGGLLGVVVPLAIVLGKPEPLREIAAGLHGFEVAAFALGGLALGAGALCALRLARQDRTEVALRSAVAGVAVLLFVVGTVLGSAWSRHQGGRAYGRRIGGLVPVDARIAVERGKFELILFYSERKGVELETDEQLVEALRGGRYSYAILSRSRYEALRDRSPFREMTLLDVGRLGDTTLNLLGPSR